MADNARLRLAPLHTRNISSVTTESDSSDTTPGPADDEDTDYFMAHANDSQSSLGLIHTLRDCDPTIDTEQSHRLTPISKLPPEILMAIFAKLTTTSDLRNCMLVSYHWALYTVGILWHRPLCNKWSNLLNVVVSLNKGERAYFEYYEMVKRLNLSAIADKVNDATVRPFMLCKGIERLTLTNCSKLTDSGVAGLVDGCKKLQALDVTDLDSLTDRTLHIVADNCTKLQGLNITNCSNITDDSLKRVAENCRQLKRLKLNGVFRATDVSITTVARYCRSILEIDLAGCQSITSESVTALLANLNHLRELRLAHCIDINDSAFTNLPQHLTFDALRILDLTACEQVRDDAIARIIPAAPRLRNLVLAKCRHITDRAVASICKLTKNLHYIHLGHCINLTDNAVIQLVKACNRIRYIDLACCSRLTDASVRHLAQLPKLRRIGLVKCQNLTDASILALAHGPVLFSPSGKVGVPSQFVSLERVHLSYCINLTLKGITALLHNCPRLTHLSLTGVQAFLREDLTRFCRDAPAEFTHPQRDVFCVFSGEGVQRLRDYLLRLAMDEMEREGRDAIDESLLDGVDSPGADTMSDDGTIDGNDHSNGPAYLVRPGVPPFINIPRSSRVRPRSMHELPSYHVEMPLLPSDQMQRFGAWTPNAPLTPEIRATLGPAHLNLMSPSHMYHQGLAFDFTRSPGPQDGFDLGPGFEERARSSSRTPSRRHTLESSNAIFGPPSVPAHAVPRPFDMFEDQRRLYAPQAGIPIPTLAARSSSGNIPMLGQRGGIEMRHAYLRPEHDYSAFDANHEAIMATIPGGQSGSGHPSRSTSPLPRAMSSRSRLTNLFSGMRTFSSGPLTFGEAASRSYRGSRSRDRSRMEEEEHREAMLRALAEADSAQQLRPDVVPANAGQPADVQLPLPDWGRSNSSTPVTTGESRGSSSNIRNIQPKEEDEDEDVTMTQ